VTENYFYDPRGNLDCVTTSGGTQAADCPTATGRAPSVKLLADYTYDYMNRLAHYLSYNPVTGQKSNDTTYFNDGLSRVTKEIEDRPETADDRTTVFSYLGLTNQVTEEDRTDSSGTTTKVYFLLCLRASGGDDQ